MFIDINGYKINTNSDTVNEALYQTNEYKAYKRVLRPEYLHAKKKRNITRKIAMMAMSDMGIPYSDVNPKDFGWDGRKFRLKTCNPEDIIHELCHWLIADPERRSIPEFGLGPGFTTEDHETALDMMIESVDETLEEYATCWLSFIILDHYGFSPLNAMDTTGYLYLHNGDYWTNVVFSEKNIITPQQNASLDKLVDLKLLNPDFSLNVEFPSLRKFAIPHHHETEINQQETELTLAP